MTRKRNQATESVVSPTSQAAAAAPAKKHRAAHVQTARPVVADSSASTESIGQLSAAVSSANASNEEIARLAYSYWERRGGQGGSPEEDWLRAERELRNRATQETAK